MKTRIAVFSSFCFLFIVIALILVNANQSKPITATQVKNLGSSVETIFNQAASQRPQQSPHPSQSGQTMQSSASAGETIMAIIYNKPDETWFIKARAPTALIDQQSAEFSRLFLTQLKFNQDNQPDFSHIPEQYLSQSSQAMRVATFNLNGVEVSVTRLAGNQSVQANINRWRGQLNLSAENKGFVKFQDNNNTVLVRLNQQVAAPPTTPSPTESEPANEQLADFLELQMTPNWSQLPLTTGMAVGRLQLTQQGNLYEVAVMRLPTQVPLDTVLGIWKERAGVAPQSQLAMTEVISAAGQNWKIIPMGNDQSKIQIAVHTGANKYTFLRMVGQPMTDAAEQEFLTLIKSSTVTKS